MNTSKDQNGNQPTLDNSIMVITQDWFKILSKDSFHKFHIPPPTL